MTYLAAVLALGIAAQWLAWRCRIPAILLLLAVGFAAGYVVRPDDFFDRDLLRAVVSLSVGVILFEGGLSLRFRELGDAEPIVWRLISIGAAVTWVGGALAARLVFDDPGVAALAGAIFVVTGPTVVIPLLRHIRPSPRVGAVARWEGIVIDPIGALLTLLVFEAVAAGGIVEATRDVLGSLAMTILLSLAIGVVAAVVFVQVLKRHWIPDYLHNPVLLAIVAGAYAVSDSLQPESGLATVTILGVIIANQKHVSIAHLVEFKENLGVVLLSMLFVLLASRLQLSDLQGILGEGLLFLAVLIFVVRPLAVYLATFGTKLSKSERTLLACLAPRGIVAAAVASVFSVELAHRSGVGPTALAEADKLVSLAFLVIIGTVTVYGLSAGPLSRALGISDTNPQGVLFAGAGPLARAIAEVLHNEGYRVELVDTNRYNVQRARMAGLASRNGNILSEWLQEELDLSGIGRLIALTPSEEINALATLRFNRYFGRSEVYQVADRGKEDADAGADEWRGRILFNRAATFAELTARIAKGHVLRKTPLTEEFGYADFRETHGDSALVMFVIRKTGELVVCTDDTPLDPQTGQTLISLIEPREENARVENGQPGVR